MFIYSCICLGKPERIVSIYRYYNYGVMSDRLVNAQPEEETKMENVRLIKGLTDQDAGKICRWTNERGEKYLEQWFGSADDFPLSVEKLKSLDNVFSIYCLSDFAGIIQRIRIENENAHIGRFVVDPEKTGKGIGEQALSALVALIFEDAAIKSISLSVFDYNPAAKRLYEKCGFQVIEIVEEPVKKHRMKKFRKV